MTSDKIPAPGRSQYSGFHPFSTWNLPQEFIWGNFLPIFIPWFITWWRFLLLAPREPGCCSNSLLSHSANAFLKISWHGYKFTENSTWLHSGFLFFFFWEQGVWSAVYHKTFRVASEDGGHIALLRNMTTLPPCDAAPEAAPWRWPSHPANLDFWWNPCIEWDPSWWILKDQRAHVRSQIQ